MLFGFASPVIRAASSVSSLWLWSLMFSAPPISCVSTRTPKAFMRMSSLHSSHSPSGTGKRLSLARIALSATTSWALYSLNSSHLSGSSAGSWYFFLKVLVGLCGVQKYRISALPVMSFFLSSPRHIASPVLARLPAYPQYSDQIMVHCHCSIGVVYPARFSAYHSNAALYACFTYCGLCSAVTILLGISSPASRSMTCTGPSSTLYPNSRILKSGSCIYR